MNYDFITPNLVVGQKIDTEELADRLKEVGVTHVINLWSGNPETFWDGDYLTLAQEDDGSPRQKDQTLAGIKYAEAVPPRGVLYVHCQWGIGRAPSMAYAILRKRGMSKLDATTLINTNRPKAAKGGWEQYIPSIEEAINA